MSPDKLDSIKFVVGVIARRRLWVSSGNRRRPLQIKGRT
ncbi:hypothetical protein Pla52o_38170 [Novipirellula galeiformis]|uniref:Uncharacterized protein n=1 Tax=Novipirellula galeiformis TaxID=2528004 RepID=A0A5C6CAL8_9BACT|nr:hypothetical protein Pla52o_38170 [Novipirellula galeiformis]